MLALASLALSLPATAGAPVAQGPSLTIDGARQAIAAAVAEAQRIGTTGVFAVVDGGGNLMALERLDGTFPAGATVSIGKARTAALFRKPTKFFEEVIRNGRTAMTALPSDLFTPLQGGVPIVYEGQVVGAIGVSGAASAQQDEDLAMIGAAAAGTAGASAADRTPATGATWIPSADVTSAFARGMPLLENDQFKIHASRRERPGQAEAHDHDTDIIYVLQGSATLVTGGAIVNPMVQGEGEVRGPSIQGGETRALKKGDVIVVPAGLPHWFKEVGTGQALLYYVVKTTSAAP
jgi:glc operon protein GlcG